MLHLQAGVDLKKIEVVPRWIVEELNRAGGSVVDRPGQPDGGVDKGLAGRWRQVRGRRLLDHLLVTPLQGAVALAQGDDRTLTVPEHLDLNVSGLGDIALQEDPGVGEGP